MQGLENPHSRIERVKHSRSGSESATKLLTVDDLIAYRSKNDGLVLEFVQWSAEKRAVESYRVIVCPEDAERIRKA